MPDTLTDAHPLLRGILDHPREWDRLLVYADWLEEHGTACERCTGSGRVSEKNWHGAWDEWVCAVCDGTGRTDAAALALGWRQLAGERRWPYLANHGEIWWVNLDQGQRAPGTASWANWLLPGRVFAILTVQKVGIFAEYDHLPAALADAARAYGLAHLAGRQPEEARRG